MQPKENCNTCPVPGQEFWWWACGSGYQDSGRISGIKLFSNSNDTHITNCSAYPGNIKDCRMSLPSPDLQKYLLQKSIFSVTIYCCILLSGSEKLHGKITMLHLLNWPCRALPLVHASSYKVKRQVCQAHAENIIIKPTRICKSVCSQAHLHSFSLVL